MAEQPKQEKKSVWFKLQEAVPDREEQIEFVSLLVRLILLGVGYSNVKPFILGFV